MNQKQSFNIILAGGGTGGHIYPALAIAQEIKKKNPQAGIVFVGSVYGLESQILPRYSFPLRLISVGPLNFKGRWLEKLKTLLKMPEAFFHSVKILNQEKPDYVLGMGGYASGPMVLVAAFMGYPCGLWEPNAFPGLANRILGYFVKECFLVFQESESFFSPSQVHRLGVPLRDEIVKRASLERIKFRASDRKLHIFCFGGSQGSRVINQTLFKMLQLKPDFWRQRIQVVHQIGPTDYQLMKNQYQGFDDFVEIHEFISDMPKYYEWADVAICRGGASTLAELSAFQVPPIVIPLPAADGHQEKNAQSFVDHQVGEMILQKNLSPEALEIKISQWMNSPSLHDSMASKLKGFLKLRAAEDIADFLLEKYQKR